MAAQRIFDVAELLEHVLFQLPMKDLLFAQKACEQCKQIINASPKLQHALFLRPMPALSGDERLKPQDVILNPLISRNAPKNEMEEGTTYLLGNENVLLRSLHLKIGPQGLARHASCRKMLVRCLSTTTFPLGMALTASALQIHQPHPASQTIRFCTGIARRHNDTNVLMLIAFPQYLSTAVDHPIATLGDLLGAVKEQWAGSTGDEIGFEVAADGKLGH